MGGFVDGTTQELLTSRQQAPKGLKAPHPDDVAAVAIDRGESLGDPLDEGNDEEVEDGEEDALGDEEAEYGKERAVRLLRHRRCNKPTSNCNQTGNKINVFLKCKCKWESTSKKLPGNFIVAPTDELTTGNK